jgi:hypothetical protein
MLTRVCPGAVELEPSGAAISASGGHLARGGELDRAGEVEAGCAKDVVERVEHRREADFRMAIPASDSREVALGTR